MLCLNLFKEANSIFLEPFLERNAIKQRGVMRR